MRRVVSCLVFLVICGAATAQDLAKLRGEVLRCDMTDKGRGGFVSDVMFFAIDHNRSQAMALDELLFFIHEGAIPVDTRKRGNGSWLFRWRVDDIPTTNAGDVSITFRASLNAKTDAVQLSGTMHGYDNRITGRGTCKKVS